MGTDDSRGIDGTRSVIFLAGCFPEVVGREWESGTQAKSRGNKTLARAAPRSVMAAWARQPYFYKISTSRIILPTIRLNLPRSIAMQLNLIFFGEIMIRFSVILLRVAHLLYALPLEVTR